MLLIVYNFPMSYIFTSVHFLFLIQAEVEFVIYREETEVIFKLYVHKMHCKHLNLFMGYIYWYSHQDFLKIFCILVKISFPTIASQFLLANFHKWKPLKSYFIFENTSENFKVKILISLRENWGQLSHAKFLLIFVFVFILFFLFLIFLW